MKKTLITLAAGLALTFTSCVGPFNLFNSLSSWNSRVTESKIVNELIFLGLYILPVYQISALGDVIIFNSFEFWGAENPISKPEEFTPQEPSEG